MKICKLKLKNLNSFRQKVDLDFESSPLGDASLVAITGPTGAGKTTLLDAICVALYGKTPRLSGTGSQHSRHLISHGEREGFAEVHFIANETRYVAIWSLRRGSPAEVRLSYAEDNKLISDKLSGKGKTLGSSQRTVSEEVESILGLDFDAFRRSVMLAQGEFAAFLKASREDRRTILEATAGIHIYDLLRQALNEKVNEVEAANAAVADALNKIPEASHGQLSEAQTLWDKLQSEAEALGTQSRCIQDEKQREEGRQDNFERLQSSKDRQDELTDQQPEIDMLQATLENAQHADSLRLEKRTYDTAKSDLENAKKALDTAKQGKTETEAQVKTDQTVYDEKEKAYQTTSQEHARKIPLYRNAKLDVTRAADQFAEADKRATALADLDKQIDVLKDELADKQVEQTRLQKQINAAQTFLDANPLPSDRQQRLNRVTSLLTQLNLQQQQLADNVESRDAYTKQVSLLENTLETLSKAHQKHFDKKVDTETTLKNALDELDNLQLVGTQDEWNARKQKAAEAQPIAQQYETAKNGLVGFENRLRDLNDEIANLNAELDKIGNKLTHQSGVCRSKTEAVERCEKARESVLLAGSVSHFRQRLQPGEPCEVCGATEHPHADVVVPEGRELLQRAEKDLADARAEAQVAQDQMQDLRTTRIQFQQDKQNVTSQIDEDTDEIEKLRDETSRLLKQWQVIYPNEDISSDWTAEQMKKADIAIQNLQAAEQAHRNASHAYQIISQQFRTCEDNIARETETLESVETQLQGVIDDIEDLKADIASTEERFWELLPETFHGVAPKETLKQFSDKIEEVATYQQELDNAESELKLLNTKIETDQGNLETLRKDRKELQAEIDGYRHDGETFLNAVREKTDGLETADEINTAIDELEGRLQLKNTERDEATQQLQESRTLLTQKQTTHVHCENQSKEASEKLKTARDAYFDKLKNAGFDSPEAHDNAFRNDAQIQDLTDQIDAHEDEKQQLALRITELQTRFEETPFDPEALGQIEAQAEEIGAQLQAKQQEIGAQQQRIDNLKDALEKRKALGAEISEAEQELKRWKRLQDTIPRNDLRDFALEIMFKQMGNLANDQLKYLTSERYQLKVESIGELSVVDRWNANEERPVETLSGGESFLTSLALALALSELSRGRAQLNSLFLDEGFGTLDAETLDIAIAALEGLRMQGRSIFLISHIQELTRRLPIKINVRKQGNGSSSIDIRG